MHLNPSLPTLLVMTLGAVVPALAQGTRADYERAANLGKLTQNKVFEAHVQPHWLEGNTRFWYRNDLTGGRREFVLVDAEGGEKRSAFDHQRLAKALAEALRRPVAADALPIDSLEFGDGGKTLRVAVRGQWWRCSLDTYNVVPDPGHAPSTGSLTATMRPHASDRTGPDTTVTFINRSKAEVRLAWINPDGARQDYGAIAAGGEYVQHTFGGHVWLVTDAEGKTLAVFQASDEPGTAVITGEVPVTRGEEPRPPRRAEGEQSPDGHFVAFIRGNNVHLRDQRSGAESALSTDGTEQDAYDGQILWSPDSSKLAAVRTLQGDDRKVYLIESSPKDQLQPKLQSYSYLKPGDRIPLSKPQLFDVADRRHIPVSDELFPNPWSITELRWEADSSAFTFCYNQRGHQVMRVVAVDAGSGAAHSVIEERSPTFIDYSGKHYAKYLDATHEIIWMSERDGWNHLYLYDEKTGQVKNQITRGEWVVRGVDEVDEAHRQIWFRAGGIRPGQDPYYIHYCRVDFDGSGLTVLTAGDGTHSVDWSPDRRFFVDTYSRVDLAPVTELRRGSDGGLVCALEKADWSELFKAGWQVPERFVAKGRDGATDIYGVIFRPTTYDPTKKYPVIENIYAGPQDSFVPKSFASLHESQVQAEIGFIVVQIDGMGTSNRSKKFHDVCWKNLGDAGFPDRILWMKAAAAKYPSMDLSRVGIYGGSAGGQSAMRALLAFNDFYKAAVADSGCHDNRMDKIWWNEQWMGWPVGPEYEQQSNVTQARNLKGNLLLIVGELDKNVDPASTMQVVNALIKADKDFDLLVVPGAGHGAGGAPYGTRRREDFFVRHLLGVEPRRD